jgi:predicted small metal-binding protein
VSHTYIAIEPKEEEETMPKKVRCNIHRHGKECPWYAHADNEEELMRKIEEHAENVHGIRDMSDEMLKKIKDSITEE